MKRFKIKTLKDVMRFMFWVIVEQEYKLYSRGMKFDGFSEEDSYYQELLAKADKLMREKKGIGAEALAFVIETTLLANIQF